MCRLSSSISILTQTVQFESRISTTSLICDADSIVIIFCFTDVAAAHGKYRDTSRRIYKEQSVLKAKYPYAAEPVVSYVFLSAKGQ